MHKERVLEQRNLPAMPRIEEDCAPECASTRQAPGRAATAGESNEGKAPTKLDIAGMAKSRRRGRRNKQGEQVEIWTFDGSGMPQLKAAMDHATHQLERPPVAIYTQEHHATSEKLPDLQAAARRLGWKVAAAKAVRTTEGGVSAGVAVCNPSCVAAGRDEKTTWDWSLA